MTILSPNFFDLPGNELEIEDLAADGDHGLGGVAAGQADVLALRVTPLPHQRLRVTAQQAHRGWRHLKPGHRGKIKYE